MASRKKDLKEELLSYKFEFDVLQKIPCSKQENKMYQKLLKDGGTLPDGVFAYIYDNGETSTTDFYTVYEADLTEREMTEYLTYKKLSLLKTIKNCAIFFTAVTIIGIVISLFAML